jgi:hypothetical protein
VGGNIKHRMSCMNYCWSGGTAWTITGVCVCVCVCVCLFLKGQALGCMLRLIMAVAEKHVVGEKYNLLTTLMNTEGSHKGVGSAGMHWVQGGTWVGVGSLQRHRVEGV